MKVLRKIESKLRLLGFKILSLNYLLRLEKGNLKGRNILKRVWCLLHGFSSEKWELYNLKENNYKLYLTDYQRRKSALINGKYALILSDKSIFDKIIKNRKVSAELYGEIHNGNLVINNTLQSFDEFINLLKDKETLIVKKNNGGGGENIYKITYRKDVIYIDDEIIKINKFREFIYSLSEYLIVEHITQAKYSNQIFPGTVNSIRIITMKDPKTDEIFIPIAVHKFGSENTKPVDNVSNGGAHCLN